MRGRSPFPGKTLVIGLLATFLASGVFGVTSFAPLTAYAQMNPAETAAIIHEDVETTAQTGQGAIDNAQNTEQTAIAVKEVAKANWLGALRNTAFIALLNGLNYFAQKVAYDAAVYVAAGDWGQKPLVFADPGAYFKSVGGDAAGEVLGSLTQNADFLKKYGVNLCAPSNPLVALNIKLGFLRGLPGLGVKTNIPTPKCTWDSIQSNWETFTSQDSAAVLNTVGVMFSPGESSLGAAIEVNNAALAQINTKKYEKSLEMLVGQGYKAVVDPISGLLKTPAQTVKSTFDYSVERGFKAQDDTALISVGALTSGALAVLTPALKTFAGTLTESLMKKVFEKGLISVTDQLGLVIDDTNLTFDAAPPLGGRATAELANASLLTPKIATISNYDELLDFASCPAEGRTPNNCVMDQQFFGAVSRADQGKPLTLVQAIQQGFVSRGWQLLPLAHRKNLAGTCYLEAFCYSNLVKLRRARVIPIGWELAANSPFNDLNRPVTLGEAMDRFNDCPMTVGADGKEIVDESKLPDPLHPWCHLIDPEWILKYPASICRQQVPGPVPLSSQSSARVQSCVDVTTCVAEDASGNCVGGYGYCVREKSAWKLDADACPRQYASCTTFRRADGQTFSYLSNTLDGAACNSGNVGCRRYSLSPNAVPNPGFEDVLNDLPRDWTLSDLAARFHRGGRLSMRGANAVGVYGGSTAQVSIGGLLPGTSYRLSGSVLQEIEDTVAIGTIRLALLNAAGLAISTGTLTTTCESAAGGTAVDLFIGSTSLGYLSGSCEITLPSDAVAAKITLSSNAAAGNRTWFDEIGLLGTSFSASPYDAIFMNAKVEKCSEDQAGCSQFARLSTGTLNMLRNPSFETSFETAAGDVPAFWDGVSAAGYESGTFLSEDGISAYALSTNKIQQTVDGILAEAAYSFSIMTRLEDSGETKGLATLQLFDTSRPFPLAVEPISVEGCDLSGTVMELHLAAGQSYAVSECHFTTPAEVGSIRISLTANDDGPPRLLADDVQLELSTRSTPFHLGYSPSVERISLKKAPEGLNCVGASPPAACARYAPSCRRDEVGCNSYQPVDGGSAIPAVTTDADVCPSECSGYDTFRQEPSNFSDARFPLFFIPTTAGSCTAAEAGCSEFTNIERLAAGGEAREYFSYLRLCAQPGPESTTFYTWEGNDERGFQLRTWGLLRSNIAAAVPGAADPTGGNAPCTKLAYDVGGQSVCADDADSVTAASCTKAFVGLNPDCREFYDEAGNIHYRFYSKTIISTEECKEYRITRTTESECRDHGGYWRNGECRYRSYAAESVLCRAEAAGCRAYSGNASRNVRIVFSDLFESGTTDGWTAALDGVATTDVINSNESVSAGGHSLKVTRADVVKDVASSIQRGRQYILTFWAKGTGDLTARLSQAGDESFTFNRVSGTEQPLSLTTEWRPYRIGPVEAVNEPADDEHLIIQRLGGGAPLVYLDNVELREVTENIFLVEDSWQTPASCDQTPNGDSAPQYMLGCRAYNDRENLLAHFKSFEKLCRPEAVGCEALYDTRNSVSPFPQTFRAVCTLPDGPDTGTAPDACSLLSCPCEIAGREVCQATTGATSCRYDADEEVSAENVSPEGDTVRVPADGITYLVNDPRFRCAAEAEGCFEAGLRTMNPDRTAVQSWSGVFLKNLPASYASTLCLKSEEFCQAYARKADGAQVYFKNPDTRACEYREASVLASTGINANGWYRQGSDDPCDPDFLEAGTRYGIWKNSDPGYEGWVGACEGRYDMCKEFIDPEDRSEAYQAGKPYYAIMNDRLDTSTCQGKASLRQSPSGSNDASACVLFWQTDDLQKTYDAFATYQASEGSNGALVTPLNTATNTANVIVKVKRDRQCGEWLDCRSSETVFNPSSGQYQNVCTAFSLCAEYERVGNTTRCVRYAKSSFTGQTLTAGVYGSRDVGWQGLEYSGYAIPNRYPVEELVTVNVAKSSTTPPDMRLVRVTGACSGNVCGPNGNEACDYGLLCGPVGDKGTCLGPSGSRLCVYPIDGGDRITDSSELRQAQSASGYPGASCRAYPQETAPFPSSVADPNGWDASVSELNNGNPILIGATPAFSGANVCQRRLVNGVEVSSCECNYVIARYGSQTKYFPAKGADLPQGYCISGQFDSYECDPLATGARSKSNLSCCSTTPDANDPFGGFSSGCQDGGSCVKLNKVDRVVGYEGQCLERDFTTPINGRSDEFACVTWRPVGLIGGSRDIFNQYQGAGYFAAADRRFYCTGAHPGWTLQFDIPALNKDTASNNDNYGDGKVGGGLSIFDTSDIGDETGSELNPYDLDIMKFFGPGVITGASSQGGSSVNCKYVGDEARTGGWCIWPGISTGSTRPDLDGSGKVIPCDADTDCHDGFECDPTPDTSDRICVSKFKTYSLQQQALGILGCYEVADQGSVDQQYIEWPYIGPPIYRQQLASIYFQITDDIYDWTDPLQPGEVKIRATETAHCPGDPRCASALPEGDYAFPSYTDVITNPHQNVLGDCNNEGDDNIDNEDGDGIDSSQVIESDIVSPPDLSRAKSVFHLNEENGWKVDPSDGEGVIILSASWNSNGQLKGLKLAASDSHDEGAFGINRLGFQYKPGCEQIVQVDQPGEFGATVAFTDSVNAQRDFMDPNGMNISDVYNDPRVFADACRPYGAVGAVASAPTIDVDSATTTRTPWTYVVSRRLGVDGDQCTDLDFLKGVTYRSQTPEFITDTLIDTDTSNDLVPPVPSEIDGWTQSFRRLFRRVFGVWSYERLRTDATGGGYDPAPSSDTYNETDIVEATPLIMRGRMVTNLGGGGMTGWYPPSIASVDLSSCDATGTCKPGTFRSMTLNGKDEGLLLGADGAMNVTAKFFAWASHDSMPILNRTVLWGDFSPKEPPVKGWYKNQKPLCSPDISDENAVGECHNALGLTCNSSADCPGDAACDKIGGHFGNTPGACAAAPYQFDHTYTCTLAELQAMPVCTGPTDAADNAPCRRGDSASPVCVYRPKVRVIDNWGWCNCTGTGCADNGSANTSGGAYGSACNTSNPPPDAKPWTEYAGEIRLTPSLGDASSFDALGGVYDATLLDFDPFEAYDATLLNFNQVFTGGDGPAL